MESVKLFKSQLLIYSLVLFPCIKASRLFEGQGQWAFARISGCSNDMYQCNKCFFLKYQVYSHSHDINVIKKRVKFNTILEREIHANNKPVNKLANETLSKKYLFLQVVVLIVFTYPTDYGYGKYLFKS